MKIAIVIDSAAGLEKNISEKNGWYFLPLGITIDGAFYNDGIDINATNIYDKFNEKSILQTSQSSVVSILEIFEKLSKEYDKVVVFPISKHLSGQYQSLEINSKNFKNILVVKSESLTVLTLAKIIEFELDIQNNVSFDTAIEKLNKNQEDDVFYLLPHSNERLVAGGRLSPKAAALAKVLKIVPVIKFEHGQLLKDSKGMVFEKICDKVAKRISKRKNHSEYFNPIILHAKNPDVNAFSKNLEEHCQNEVLVSYIPSVIAIHTGEKALAYANLNYRPEVINKLKALIN
ncbi:DegV family protein with EDD domain [Mycoplasma testudineum]|uniref:DegV family protein with EDD domain n=1 Tax=Mycoplasma testudineum TaxID=244584 RepID=A0A4V3C390_9MOLU|nr:DegV family protein [Mycoplasma testudineum]OYD27100.1 hypothetical protein CG473_00445 [Mycoplasma testudineum]TDO21149.1 DegV family protein with EDD domain [Mycoplasma testudineum]